MVGELVEPIAAVREPRNADTDFEHRIRFVMSQTEAPETAAGRRFGGELSSTTVAELLCAAIRDAFSSRDVDDAERGERIGPPPIEHGVADEADEDDR